VDHIHDWQVAREVQTGTWTATDYDFELPKGDLTVKRARKVSHSNGEAERFEYPGGYVHAYAANGSGDADAMDRGGGFARARVEELQTAFERFSGLGNVRALKAGGLFKLTEFVRDDENAEYLVTSCAHTFSVSGYEGAGSATPATLHQCAFTAMSSGVPYRSARLTPRPRIHGPQTATVVGKSGEEIWTDAHGRVKVQFHWDRYGGFDENSSCWVRVAQHWAGMGWGGIQIPRMGQEVIVEFLDGDPDRPIVTGRVYNGDQKPPYDLPANQTQSGVKRRSSKGGGYGNANAIRFEDKKGSEQLWIHAEKNQDIEVEHDETHAVGNDRSKTIGHDETVHVKNNRTETVDKDESITIGGSRTESVAKNENISIGESRSESVGKDETIDVSGQRTESVAKDESVTIGQNRRREERHDLGRGQPGDDGRQEHADRRRQDLPAPGRRRDRHQDGIGEHHAQEER
jgi:type VI secretion system secreted protein VgrG